MIYDFLKTVKYIKYSYLILTFLVLNLNSGRSQIAFSKHYVSNQFEENHDQLWLNQYVGYLDGFHRFEMILGTDGNEVHGVYKYNDELSFEISGIKKGNVYELVEFDKSGNHSGILKIDFHGTSGLGEWSNLEQMGSIPFSLNVEDAKEHECSGQIWSQYLYGKSQEKTIDLYINKEFDYYEASLFHNEQLIKKLNKKSNSTFEVLSADFSNSPNLNKISISIDNGVIGVSSEGSRLKTRDTYFQQEVLSSVCESDINYRQKVSIIYPKYKDKNFNQIIHEQIKTWKSQIEEYHLRSYRSDPADIAKDRLIDESFIWYEIDVLNKNIISGNLYFQCSWDDGVQKFNFNYDNRKNKFIEPKKLVNKNIDLNLFCKSYSNDIKKTFQYININHTGLVLRTDYDIFYGQDEKHLPFSEIGGKLNKKYFSKN